MTCPKPGLFNHSHALSQHLKHTQGPNSAWCHLMYSYFLDQLYPDLNKSNQHNRQQTEHTKRKHNTKPIHNVYHSTTNSYKKHRTL